MSSISKTENTNFAPPAMLSEVRTMALFAALVGGAGLAIAAFMNFEEFLRGYLIAYVFVLGLSLGSLALRLCSLLKMALFPSHLSFRTTRDWPLYSGGSLYGPPVAHASAAGSVYVPRVCQASAGPSWSKGDSSFSPQVVGESTPPAAFPLAQGATISPELPELLLRQGPKVRIRH